MSLRRNFFYDLHGLLRIAHGRNALYKSINASYWQGDALAAHRYGPYETFFVVVLRERHGECVSEGDRVSGGSSGI